MKQTFELLDEFIKLPNYQAERRIDIFIVPYLSKMLDNHFSASDFRFILPELPLNPGDKEYHKRKLTDYADYMLWSKQLNLVCLVELKTEINSIKNSQFISYEKTCRNGWQSLIELYFYKAIKNKKHWKKYVSGLEKISSDNSGLLGIREQLDIIKYKTNKTGHGINARLETLKKSISFDKQPEMNFVYIVPKYSEIKNHFLNKKTDFYKGFITLSQLSTLCDHGLSELLIKIDTPDPNLKQNIIKQN